MPEKENFPEMDEKGSIIGVVPREVAHRDKSRIHPGVRIFILDPNTRKTLLQFRGEKDLDPHCWDYGGGGHPKLLDEEKIETFKQAAIRELQEEVKLKPSTYKLKQIPGHEIDRGDPTQTEWATWFIAEIPENKMPSPETKTKEVEKLMIVSFKHLYEIANRNPSDDNPLRDEKIRPMLIRDLKRPKIKAALKRYLK